MKWFCAVLRIAAGVLVMLLSLLFLIIEAVRLCTGDFLLYEAPAAAALQLVLRYLLLLLAGILGLRAVTGHGTAFEGICLLASAAAAAPFLSNGCGIGFIAAAGIFFIAAVLSSAVEKR